MGQQLEDVQQRATSLLATIKDSPYPEHLAILKLPILEYRGIRGAMIEVSKYVTGIHKTSCPIIEKQIAATRGNSLKLIKQQHKTTIRGNYLTVKALSTWNSLPEAVVSAPNHNTFKARLDSFWRELPSVHNLDCYQTF